MAESMTGAVSSPPSWVSIIDTFSTVAESGNGAVVWGPGAAGVYVDKDDATKKYLLYAIATGAQTQDKTHTGPACQTSPVADIPPGLHFYYKSVTSPLGMWAHEQITLVEDPANPACYELQSGSTSTYVPIDTPAGVAIRGNAAYVATNDGLFWMYSSLTGIHADGSPNQYVISGPANGWPRFRKDNFGSARSY
jgi:hypothetical protein